MANTTIKEKIGTCVDCPPGTAPQPIIAGRCKKIHYKRHRAIVSSAKKAAKEESGEKKPLPKKIPRRSKKGQKEDRKYTVKRLQFLAQPKNLRCPITGEIATEIHHMKGRVGKLLLDDRFWLAVSREGHRRIEENPEWAKEMGYSLSRLT